MAITRVAKRTRSDGERSRREILLAAARISTIHGLQHLSIGQLADEVGMSKSGLYAHFGSKEELQLATVETAEEIYAAEVYAAIADIQPGLRRLLALLDAHLDHMRRGVFPNGCFFDAAAADLVSSPGPVRDRITGFLDSWSDRIVADIELAMDSGEIPREDVGQLTYDLIAPLSLAHSMLTVYGDRGALDRAAASVRRRLGVA